MSILIGGFSMFLAKLNSPEDWKQFLADSEKHWKNFYSAKTLAYIWQNANGFPDHIKKIIKDSLNCDDIEFLFGIPEHKVMIPGGSRPSQNDIFILSRTQFELIPIMVEGKVDESFGPFVKDWLLNASKGKQERLTFLSSILELTNSNIESIRYQLLHRTASVIIEAKKYFAQKGIMLVHSFSDLNRSFEDYQNFLKLYSLEGMINDVVGPVMINGIYMYFGWIHDSFPQFPSE